MVRMFWMRNYRYSALNGDSKVGLGLLSNWSLQSLVAALFIFLSIAGSSFYAGRISVDDKSLLTIPLATRSKVFHYDQNFGAAPSNVTDLAWAALFPEQGGFFKHPTIAPQRSAFAVFHQLHCLNSIREGFWAVYHASVEGRKIVEDDMPMMSSPPHIRHCIDLIRQSLICKPDTTVEVKNEELGGVTGFGTEHQCRDWDQLVSWTSEWQAYNQDPKQKIGNQDPQEPHSHHGHM